MNEKKVELTDGGRVWITTRPSYGQAKAAKRAALRLWRFLDRSNQVRTDLSQEERDQFDAQVVDTEGQTIRNYVVRWEDVRASNGDLLEFPADVDRLAQIDVDFLVGEIEAAIRESRADPNAGMAILSPGSPPRARSPRTRRKP